MSTVQRPDFVTDEMSTEPKWAKPLVWEDVPEISQSYAHGVVRYMCCPGHPRGMFIARVLEMNRVQFETFSVRDTMESAKAACQAHHEASVRALLNDDALRALGVEP